MRKKWEIEEEYRNFCRNNKELALQTLRELTLTPTETGKEGSVYGASGDGMPFVQTETKAGMKVSNLYISQVKRVQLWRH